MSAYRASYRRAGFGYEGVIKNAKNQVVWACGHIHNNRDQDTQWNSAASPCASRVLRAVRQPGCLIELNERTQHWLGVATLRYKSEYEMTLCNMEINKRAEESALLIRADLQRALQI